MNETTENFWKVWNSLPPWSPPVVFWRLYYDDQGFPLFYTQEDKPGNYIDVTPEQYRLASMRVRVRNGQLVELKHHSVKKLMPSSTGTPCHPQDVAIVVSVDSAHQCWRIKTNETN
jgi:hypothetical protein